MSRIQASPSLSRLANASGGTLRSTLKPRTARIAPKNPVFCSCEFNDRTRDETTAIRIREAGIPSWAQGLRLTVRAPLASHVHTLTLAKTELCLIAVSEVA
jgi:hypothetical protein